MKEFKNLLFPIDFSASSNKIIPYVVTMAQAFGSQVHLLYVVRDFKYLASFHVPHPSLDKLESEVVENAKKMIARAGEENFPAACITRIATGDAASEIIQYSPVGKNRSDHHGHPRSKGSGPDPLRQCGRERREKFTDPGDDHQSPQSLAKNF